MSRFDVVVVGAGMIGSAAARHLAESGHAVAVVGPAEPVDWKTDPGPFASHYDEGRITRYSAKDATWSELAARSIARYDDIETRSGIRFHEPHGLAWIGHDLGQAVDSANHRGGTARMVTADWLAATTGIVAPPVDGYECMFEAAPAGTVNPRRLVAAELTLAIAAGAVHIASAVTGLTPTGAHVVVATAGEPIDADRVLLATGAYGASMIDVDLDLDRRLRTTVRADLGARGSLPTLIADGLAEGAVEGIYWVPPIEYPNRKTMLKIGGVYGDVPTAESNADIDAWFASDGSPKEATALRTTVSELLPNRTVTSWDTVPCVVTDTPSGYPYIGWVDDRVGVALAGCGASAKSCDEIGRLASTLFSAQGWNDDELGAETFTPVAAR